MSTGSQLFRRDFVFGGLGGVAVGVGGVLAGRAVAKKLDPTADTSIISGGGNVACGQFGEDLIIEPFREYANPPLTTYLDIGAYDPVRGSNTYLCYRKGGHGVLVEPNPDLTARLRAVRPRDTVLPVGIGVTDDPHADYYLMMEPQLNTFDKDQAERLDREGFCRIREVVKLPLVNVNKVIAEHFGGAAPNILSIDIEGFDLPVLRSLDLARYRPKLICAETLITATKRHNPDTLAFLKEHGYEVVGMTLANTIALDRALLG